jgi:NADPH:quinone reductase
VGDAVKQRFAVQSGADHAVLVGGWLDGVRELVGDRAVDLVLDPVGGDRMTDSLRSLAPEGRLLVLGFAAGEIPTVKVNRLLLGNTAVVGVASREFLDQQPEVVAQLWARLLELRRTRALPDPPVQRFPFADARRALEAIAGRQATGKVVLTKQVEVPQHQERRPG